jgi:hypothetical protein
MFTFLQLLVPLECGFSIVISTLVGKRSPLSKELEGESTLQGGKNCCHIVLVFGGHMFEF